MKVMKVELLRVELLAAINTVIRTVANQSPLPALTGILVDVTPTEVRLTGYNLKTGMSTKIPAFATTSGRLVIPARMFAGIVQKSTRDEVYLEADLEKPGTVVIRSAESRFRIQCYSAEEFPSLPKLDEEHQTVVEVENLATLLKQTSYAIASPNSGYDYLKGELFELKGDHLRLSATDGYRIATVTTPVVITRNDATVVTSAGEEFSAIVPGEAIKELQRFPADKPVTFRSDHQFTVFSAGDTVLITRKLSGRYPDIDKLVGVSSSFSVKASASELSDAVERCALVSNSEQLKSPLKCNFSRRTLEMSMETSVGRCKDTVQIRGKEDLEIWFNHVYLLQGIAHAPQDEVHLGLSNSVSACLITCSPKEGEAPSTYTALVLPVRQPSKGGAK